MGKYFVVYKNSLSTYLQYRLNLGLLMIGHIIILSGLIFLWWSVYASGGKLGGYTFEGIVIYYILTVVLHSTVSMGIGMGFEIIDEINQGEVTNYLLRPFSYVWKKFYESLGQITIAILFTVPIVFILGFFYRGHFIFPDIWGWIRFVFSCVIVFFFEFLIYFFISLFSFWLQKANHLVYGMLIVSGLLNGAYLPLDLFPEWAYRIIHFLPFQFLVFFPIQVFLGKIDNWLEMLLIAFVWLIILVLLVLFVWKKGIRKFEALGR